MKFLKTFESYKEFIDNITVDFINSHIDYSWDPNDPQIWRGIKSENLPDTHIYHREDSSRDILGSMWHLLEKLPSWRKFTNRKRSIIGTTNKKYSDNWSLTFGVAHGESYVLVPLKNEAYVGVSKDFNIKGLPMFNKFKEEFYSPRILLLNLARFVEKDINNSDNVNLYSEEYFNKIVAGIEDLLNSELSPNTMKNKNRYLPVLEYIKEHNFNTLGEMLDHLLNPKRNGYRKIKYTELIQEMKNDPDMNLEVWFESDCFLIREEDYKNLKDSSSH